MKKLFYFVCAFSASILTAHADLRSNDGVTILTPTGQNNINSGHIFIPQDLTSSGSGDHDATAVILDATGEWAGWVLQATRTCDISSIHFRTGTVTTGGTLPVSVQTVDLTNGEPSGTNFDTDTDVDVVIDTTDNVFYEAELTADASVTQGDFFGVRIDWGTGVDAQLDIGGANFGPETGGVNYPVSFIDSTVTKSGQRHPNLAVECSDGTFMVLPGTYPLISVNIPSVSNASTPDEYGNVFQLPMSVIVCGAAYVVNNTSEVNFELSLYDSADTELVDMAVDGDVTATTGNTEAGQVYFDANVTLAANTVYRLTIRPTEATTIQLYESNNNTEQFMNAMPFANKIYKTTRTDSGAWTDDASRRVMVALMVCGF